jgi:hypothetical protein
MLHGYSGARRGKTRAGGSIPRTPTASNSKLIIIILHWVKYVTLKVAFSIKTDSIEFTCVVLHGQFI